MDLSAYAGKEILLRFEMVTDDAVNKPGLLIDNLRIPEINWQDDVETGEQDWTSRGLDPHRQLACSRGGSCNCSRSATGP